MNDPKPLTGTVIEIQRMSTEDGPGLRTTVFFKGCTLKCAWCHNPESISPKPQIQWIGNRCIGCKTCLDVCPEKALILTENGMVIDREKCRGCGECAEECPSTALELMGEIWTVPDLAAEAAKDRAYFNQSGGGVTASGGEACMQPEFVAAFLAGCREKGLGAALDTCGQVSAEALKNAAGNADLVLFDLKEIDTARHKTFTGHSNDRILANVIALAGWMKAGETKNRLWVRTPIIPGATDRPETVSGIGRFIAENLAGVVDRWELCAFNNLCLDKYLRLGMVWEYAETELMRLEDMERLASVAGASGVNPEIVHWSGSTRMRDDSAEEQRPRPKLVQANR